MHPRHNLSGTAWSQTPHQRSVRIGRPHTLAAYTCPRLPHQGKNPPRSKHRMIAGHGIGLRVARWGRACGLSCGRARSPAPAATQAKILNGRIVVKGKLAMALVLRLAGGAPGRLHGPSTDRSGSSSLFRATDQAPRKKAKTAAILSLALSIISASRGDGWSLGRSASYFPSESGSSTWGTERRLLRTQ
jgi:hypothetical protein